MVGKTSRTGPAASCTRSYWLCGSHLTQSHSGWRSSAATTATRSSSGAWKLTSCASIARVRSVTGCRSPRSTTRENERRLTAIGRPGTLVCARTKRRSAIAVIGSRSSTGLVSGVTTETASRCGPTAIRISAKSSSVGRRSHIRRETAIAQRASGAG